MDHIEMLGRLDERLKGIETTLATIKDQTHTQATIINTRVSKLEHWRSKLNGIWFTVLTAAGVVSFLTAVVLAIFKF